ncbi:YceI-like domain protein [compost metagenome]
MLGLAALQAPARGAEPLRYTFTPESTVTYHVSHPLHGATGVSHQLAGTISLMPGANPELVIPLRLSVPLASFDSGNRNRDRNMLSVMSAARYPEAVLVIERVTWINKQTSGSQTSAEGTGMGSLTLKGVSRPITVSLNGSLNGPRLEVNSRFSVLLSEYGIERPSLLFRPIDDRVDLDITGIAAR